MTRIEIEITPGQWIEVSLDQLTDDHEEHPPADDPEVLNGSSWYLDGDYTVPPREIRVIEESEEDLPMELCTKCWQELPPENGEYNPTVTTGDCEHGYVTVPLFGFENEGCWFCNNCIAKQKKEIDEKEEE